MERKTLASLCFFLIFLLAARNETPNQHFRGACIGSSRKQECDYGCRRGVGWRGGYCKKQKCVCDCTCIGACINYDHLLHK
ncbi:Defensin-like protein [Medicago truncatula]|uniref:Defensin-like protein n=1 Tax=Medicago truncatula TaxID=3880 RepID=A0A072U6Y4_MEDTR|nr:Defensin-like protein [Medicago truncatula]